MYTDIFLFIIAFSAFSLYAPQQPAAFSVFATLLCCLAGMAALYLVCRLVFYRFCTYAARRAEAPDAGARHGAALTRAKTAALLVYILLIVGCDRKQALLSCVWHSEFVLSLCGIAVFCALLLSVWCASYPSYRNCCDSNTTLKEYVFSCARMSCTLILPWLFFAALLDGVAMLPDTVSAYVQDNPLVLGALLMSTLIAMGIFFPWVIVRLWGCRELPEGPARQHIKQICLRARIRFAGICLWNLFGGRLISAGVMGFVPAFRYLLISPALLDLLDHDELEAVVAHEIGHVRHRHALFYLAFILGYGVLATLVYTPICSVVLTSDLFFDLALKPDGTFGLLYHVVPIAVLVALLLLYFRVFFGYVSRAFERQADGAAFSLTGTAAGIIGSLEKIARDSCRSRTAPCWHHYSIAERSDYLRSCERTPELVVRHSRRVRSIMAAYCIVFMGLAALGCLNRQSLIDFESRYALIFVEKMTQRLPHDPALRFQLAGMYYEKKLFSAAEKEYRTVLQTRPDFYDAYNNLAWLYATCEDESLRNYPEALRMARIAVSLAPQPHILDTLAECLFVNGLYRLALRASEQALAAQPKERAYYEKQRKKFADAYSAQKERMLYDSGDIISL